MMMTNEQADQLARVIVLYLNLAPAEQDAMLHEIERLAAKEQRKREPVITEATDAPDGFVITGARKPKKPRG